MRFGNIWSALSSGWHRTLCRVGRPSKSSHDPLVVWGRRIPVHNWSLAFAKAIEARPIATAGARAGCTVAPNGSKRRQPDPRGSRSVKPHWVVTAQFGTAGPPASEWYATDHRPSATPVHGSATRDARGGGRALGACSVGAAPAANTAAAPPTAAPVVTPAVTLAPPPSPTVAIVKITPIPSAPDSGTVVQLVAVKTKWNPTTLTAPASKVWHVHIDNQDVSTLKHNFTVASGPTFPERIFQVPDVAGTHTFDIPALPAGSYFFICTIHPESMTGTLIIK